MKEKDLFFNSRTGEYVNLVRKVCECGHVLTFLSNHSMICSHCSRTVYPSKKSEFKEKLERKLRK